MVAANWLHPRQPQKTTTRELESRIDRLEADLAAFSDDRRWIVTLLADLALELESLKP